MHERRRDMSAAAPTERVPFEDAPPYHLESWLGLMRAGHPQVVRRAVLAVAIAWLPLAVLTLVRGDFIRPDHANAFVLDIGCFARYLIAVPLLVLAEALCAPRLTAIARQFITAGLLAEADHPAYEKAVASTRRLLRSRAAEIAAFILAYALVVSVVASKPDAAMPLWHGVIWGDRIAPTPAGWWALLVSLPLLFLLLLGWLWRVGLWARFLWLMSRLELKLVPSHPDGAGGLGFLSTSLEAFLPLAFAFGVLGAGPVLNYVVHRGASATQFRFQAVGVAVFTVVLFGAPLLVFMRRLLDAYHRGVLAYGAFTLRAGEQFERQWLAERQAVEEQTLQARDFAATNALFSIARNAIKMSRLPFEARSIAVLGGAALLPFLPAEFLNLPFDVVLKKIGGFFI
jgi:hypothetical protein